MNRAPTRIVIAFKLPFNSPLTTLAFHCIMHEDTTLIQETFPIHVGHPSSPSCIFVASNLVWTSTHHFYKYGVASEELV